MSKTTGQDATPIEIDLSAGVVPASEGFPAKRAAEIVDISYRQLDYWTRTGLVSASCASAEGSGTRRAYSYSDLLELRAIKSLLDAGIKLESVREVVAYLRDELKSDIASVSLVISGKHSVVVRSGEELVELLRKQGQGVLNVLPLAGVKQDVDAKIVDLFPARSSDKPVGEDIAAGQ